MQIMALQLYADLQIIKFDNIDTLPIAPFMAVDNSVDFYYVGEQLWVLELVLLLHLHVHQHLNTLLDLIDESEPV
jgi:hypothetical protein